MVNELRDVFKTIENRKLNPKEGSYTNKLLNEGNSKIFEKIDEESKEVIKSVNENEGNQRLVEEVDDLIYHLFVLMVNQGVKFEDLEKEERKRMN